jgi:hypothetical protein
MPLATALTPSATSTLTAAVRREIGSASLMPSVATAGAHTVAAGA